MTALELWARALCRIFGHRLPSQRGDLLRYSHVRCTRCTEHVRAPIEEAR